MDIEIITNALSTLGFPIVFAGILLYLLYKEQTKDDTHIDRMIEALRNNTEVMTEIKATVSELRELVLTLSRRLDRLEKSEVRDNESENPIYSEDEKTG